MRPSFYIGIGILFLCLFSGVQTILLNGKESLLSKIMNWDGDKDREGASSICPICQMVLGKLLMAVKSGFDRNKLAHGVEQTCLEMNIAPPSICRMIVPVFKDEVFAVLKTTPLNTDEICRQLVGHEFCNLNSKSAKPWDVQLPNKAKPSSKPNTPKLDNPNVRIVHLTDFHYDPLYTEGANVHCPEPVCCRRQNGMAGFRVPAAGMFGHTKDCDLPKATLISVFKHLASIQDQFDMVFCTGDLPPHDIWKQDKETSTHVIREITGLFKQFLPKKKIFFAIGNHDSVPVNNFPPPYIKSDSAPHWLFPTIAKAWSPWLPSETKTTIEKGAFYSVSPVKGLRIISLNTNYCYRMNFWLLVDSVDPAGQLKWLVNELQNAEDNGEKVHIIGHVPPGGRDCLSEWQRNYFKIISRYEHTVVAQFFGHTHTDSFQVSYNKQSQQPETISYITGSLTPHTMLNPGFRIYHIDADRKDSTEGTWTVVDHESYILNLTEANISKRAQWNLEYSAKDAYKMTSQLPGDWDKVIKNMESDDKLFQMFYRYHHKSHSATECNTKCKKKFLCSLRFDYIKNYESC